MIRDPLMMLLPPSAKVPRKPRTNNRRPAVINYEPEPDHYADPEVIEAAYALMLLSGNRDMPKPCTEPVNTRDKGKRIAEEYDYDRHYHEHDKPASSRSAKGKRCAEDDDGDDDARRKKKVKWVAEDEDHENNKPFSSRNAERKRFVEDDGDDGARDYEEMEMFAEGDDDDDDEDYNKPSSSRNAAKVVKKARTSNKRNNTRPVINDRPEPPPTLSEEYVNAINAMARGRAITQEPMLVIEKNISPTDLNHIHNRLAIPYNQVANVNFLSERENQRLLEREAKLTKDGRPYKNRSPCSLEVKVIVPSLECVTMNLRRWDMSSSFIYALTNKWTDIARKNRILVNTVIRVWAFRIDGEENVCFLLESRISRICLLGRGN